MVVGVVEFHLVLKLIITAMLLPSHNYCFTYGFKKWCYWISVCGLPFKINM